ncbi:MAG: PilT/PilU family type 4a pilus ATPase [Planctomycetota bacterium]
MDLQKILSTMMSTARGVSDINFTVGRPPQVEANGALMPAVHDPQRSVLTAEKTFEIAEAVMGDNQSIRQMLEETGACDCAVELDNGIRLRANVFLARGNLSVVLRVLPGTVPTLKQLRVPEALSDIPYLNNGLVLVTGATGSGKTTTLAAIIDAINSTREVHVVTLEDPIEFLHEHRKATINQREKGSDFSTFAGGLRSALRQAPKVILVGELRDSETMEIALKAAETGHLVLSTLHTIDAGQSISRIAGMFAHEEQRLVRSRVSQVLRYVVGQRLLPRRGSGRVAAVEIMGTDLRVRELIENGESEDKTFYHVISEGRPFGWQTFDQHIAEMFEGKTISREVAMAHCSDRSVMRREIDRIRSRRGEDTADLGELELEFIRASDD